MLLMTINFAETREEIIFLEEGGGGMRWESGRRRVSERGGGANGCLPLAEGGMRGRRNS